MKNIYDKIRILKEGEKMQNKTFYYLLTIFFVLFIISLLMFFDIPILPLSTITFGEMSVETEGPMEIVFMVFAVIFACLMIILVLVKIYNEIKKAKE